MPKRGRVFTPAPLTKHPLNEGRVLWLYGLPELSGGPNWFDLCGLYEADTVGSPAWVATPRGDQGLRFNGTSQYASCGTAVPLSTGPYVLGCWANPDAGGSGTKKVLARGATTGQGDVHTIITWDASSSVWKGEWNNSGTGYSSGTVAGTPGVWSRVLLIYTGSNIYLCVNGAATNVAGSTGTPATTAGAFFVANFNTGGEPFPGTVADVGWWPNRLVDPVSFAAADYDQALRGHPDTLRRVPTRTYYLTSSGRAVAWRLKPNPQSSAGSVWELYP